MLRRTFLKLAGLLCPLARAKGPMLGTSTHPDIHQGASKHHIPEEVADKAEAHYFDWTGKQGDFTTDPRYIGRMPRGRGTCIITVDGKVIDDYPVTRMVTGPNGWVEHAVYDEINKTFVHEYINNWTGEVYETFEAYKEAGGCGWQIKDPEHVDKDGNLIPKWEERLLKRVIRGHVTFQSIADATT